MTEFTVDVEREEDGRWIGEVTDLPGVLCYGATREEAVAKATALAFRILAERLDHGENILPVGPGWLAEADRRYQEIRTARRSRFRPKKCSLS